MSSPEWSLLNRIPIGITIHYMDAGIDTAPFFKKSEFPDVAQCESLIDLRNRLVAFGAERVGSVVEGLIRGTMFATRNLLRIRIRIRIKIDNFRHA